MFRDRFVPHNDTKKNTKIPAIYYIYHPFYKDYDR